MEFNTGNMNSLKHEVAIVDSPSGHVAVVRTRDGKKAIPCDEPVFLIREKDVHAVDALRFYWSAIAHDLSCNLEHATGVMEAIEEFKKWQGKNPNLVRQPD